MYVSVERYRAVRRTTETVMLNIQHKERYDAFKTKEEEKLEQILLSSNSTFSKRCMVQKLFKRYHEKKEFFMVFIS